MELFITPGSDGIVSFDRDSVLVLAYLYLGNCPIDVKDTIRDDVGLSKLPLLLHGGIETCGAKDVLNYLRSQNYGLEYGLSDADVVELAALVSVVDRQLTPAVDWFLWAEDNVFVKFTRKWFTASLTHLAALRLPYKWRQKIVKKARNSRLVNCLRDIPDAEVGNELYAVARRCLTALSYMLGKKNYFVADKPTAIDAYVFSCLWPLLLYESRHGNANWQSIRQDGATYTGQSASHPFISHVIQCPNLVAHFIRIQNEFFPKAASHFGRAVNNNVTKSSAAGDSLISHPVRDCLLFAGFAVGLFFVYAHSRGFIRILPV